MQVSEVDLLLDKRKKLRRLSQENTDMDYQLKITEVEEEISKITCWKDANNIIISRTITTSKSY